MVCIHKDNVFEYLIHFLFQPGPVSGPSILLKSPPKGGKDEAYEEKLVSDFAVTTNWQVVYYVPGCLTSRGFFLCIILPHVASIFGNQKCFGLKKIKLVHRPYPKKCPSG